MPKPRNARSFGYGGTVSRTIQIPTSGEYLTLPQAEALVQLSMWTLRNYIKKGRLPCIRIGRRIVLDRRDLLAFMESHKTQPTAP